MNLPQKISAHSWLAGIFIFLFVLGAYSPVLDSSFKVIYDEDYIVGNPAIRNPHDLSKIFGATLFKANLEYRPLTVLSHAFEYCVFSLTPFFYYLTNILIHLANVFLAYGLMVLLTKERAMALAVSLLFALHPMNWETVSFLSGRPDLLNNFFNLSALFFAVLYLRRLNGWWMAASVVCFTLALLCRESREAFVWVFFFYFAFMARQKEIQVIRWLIFLPYAVVTFLYIGLRQGLMGMQIPIFNTHLGMKLSGVLESVGVQLKALLVPMNIHIHQTAFVGRMMSGSYMDNALAVFVIFILGAIWFYRRNIDSVILFLIGWLMVGLWPVIQTAFSFEGVGNRLAVTDTSVYLLVLPVTGLAALGLCRILKFLAKESYLVDLAVTLVTVGFITLFFILTYQNNVQTSDELAILEDAQYLEPLNAFLQYSLGLVCAHKNKFQDAQAHFEQALKINPDSTEARLGLGKNFYMQGKFLDAAKMYESIQSPGKYQMVIENNLRAAYNVLTLSQEAISSKNPQDIHAHFNLGVFYSKIGELTKAINSYQRVIEVDAENKEGLRNLALKFQGMLYQQVGNTTHAQENFERARQ